MFEFWVVLIVFGVDFFVFCFSRRIEKWSKVVGIFYEDGTVFFFF